MPYSKLCAFFLFYVFAQQSKADPIMTCYAKTGKPMPEQIDPFLCTHYLLIGNVTLNADGLGFPNTSLLARYVNLKQINPDLKILLSLTPENRYMSQMAVNITWIEAASIQVRDFLLQNNLDGYDFDWEFPVWSGDSQWSDKEGFVQIAKTFRAAFDQSPRRLLLTAAVVAMYNIADLGYNAPELNKYLDYIQIMNYDFHRYSVYRPFTSFNAPLHKEPYEQWIMGYVNSEFSTQHWLELGISPEKLIFGIPVYGIGYELLNSSLNGLYSPATNYSKYGSTIPYRKACAYMKMKQFKYTWDDYAKTPYIVNGRQWLAVEDKKSVRAKADYARSLNIGGVMVFALDSDDYDGRCKDGTYPLLREIKYTLMQKQYKIEFIKMASESDKWIMFGGKEAQRKRH
ncbi:hypothetical protein M3Y97_00939500 [Aphelenchoides bicaudatus]|nr:hypothetical protein M3Y97_00939500 [Aphelenchoides bicaudatus]